MWLIKRMNQKQRSQRKKRLLSRRHSQQLRNRHQKLSRKHRYSQETPAQPEVPKQPAAHKRTGYTGYGTAADLVNLPIAQELCSGDGVFSWSDGAFVPSTYETDCQVIFTPNDITNYDYSAIPGWDAGSNTVIRTIKVQVTSLNLLNSQQWMKLMMEKLLLMIIHDRCLLILQKVIIHRQQMTVCRLLQKRTPVDGTSSADTQQTVVDSSNDGTADKTIEDGSLEDESKKDETTKAETTADETTEDETTADETTEDVAPS